MTLVNVGHPDFIEVPRTFSTRLVENFSGSTTVAVTKTYTPAQFDDVLLVRAANAAQVSLSVTVFDLAGNSVDLCQAVNAENAVAQMIPVQARGGNIQVSVQSRTGGNLAYNVFVYSVIGVPYWVLKPQPFSIGSKDAAVGAGAFSLLRGIAFADQFDAVRGVIFGSAGGTTLEIHTHSIDNALGGTFTLSPNANNAAAAFAMFDIPLAGQGASYRMQNTAGVANDLYAQLHFYRSSF